ncbi:probable Ufm1-specific protease isoform X2 [Arachis hypogaea]|uniref:probable Ufm1-specific protease isoform X2 n=1 Tax=Arachis hypogaea TaxID=3818 RepID=UPI003B21415C
MNADTIQVSVLFNSLGPLSASAVPVAEYIPTQDEVRLLVVDIKLDVLCYASKKLPLRHAVSRLTIPGLADQLNALQIQCCLTFWDNTRRLVGFIDQ